MLSTAYSLLPPLSSGRLIEIFDDFCWIACHDNVIGNIFCYDRARGNDDVMADGHTRVNYGSATNPHIISDGYWLTVFRTLTAQNGIQWMSSSVNVNAGSQGAVFSYSDGADIEHNAIK